MILKSAQYLYGFGSGLKNKLYDRNYIKKIKLDVSVISVGNLSVGGTGKTPCVEMLVSEISKLDRFKKIVIVSRSYKAGLRKPSKVDLKNPEAVSLFGDEPCLLQTILPHCSVWSGPSKSQTALAAMADRPDLIIVDDGFSHRKLARNFDLVLIDATAPFNYFQQLPVGRLREPLSQLARAQAVLITRTNLVDVSKIEKIKQLILKSAPKLIDSIYQSESLTVVPGVNPGSELFVFCGLGNPKSFKASLEALGYKVTVFKEFPDHYQYSNSDLDMILAEFDVRPGLKLVTTEKDLIKIKGHALLDSVCVAKNKIEITQNKKGDLIEKICKSF
ncbi:MAG: tetraacyldisaccharide 4'-kinase [Bdellovibrio sp.]|nr:tetraacyldisaccharide 4'-kinase [Bdellovibrio sp.]